MEKSSMSIFADLLQKWKEPTPDMFDAYFYDFDCGCYDFSILPEFLREYAEYPEIGGGTSKFLYLLYKFSSRASLGLECGVFNGLTTIPLAKGLEQNDGLLVSIDLNLNRPLLHERIRKHNLVKVYLMQGNDLTFSADPYKGSFDFVYIDSLHTYEHTLKELFLFDQYLRPGGVFLLHDLIVPLGTIDLIGSREDKAYVNAEEFLAALAENSEGKHVRHISTFPICQLAPNHLLSPIYLSIQTFLSYRPQYRLFKNLDFAGLGVIWKLPDII
jgi:predicted O-methyltransferase YrrM